jgi:hypothetical protein
MAHNTMSAVVSKAAELGTSARVKALYYIMQSMEVSPGKTEDLGSLEF